LEKKSGGKCGHEDSLSTGKHVHRAPPDAPRTTPTD
jgi:hypothetical protein